NCNLKYQCFISGTEVIATLSYKVREITHNDLSVLAKRSAVRAHAGNTSQVRASGHTSIGSVGAGNVDFVGATVGNQSETTCFGTSCSQTSVGSVQTTAVGQGDVTAISSNQGYPQSIITRINSSN